MRPPAAHRPSSTVPAITTNNTASIIGGLLRSLTPRARLSCFAPPPRTAGERIGAKSENPKFVDPTKVSWGRPRRSCRGVSASNRYGEGGAITVAGCRGTAFLSIHLSPLSFVRACDRRCRLAMACSTRIQMACALARFFLLGLTSPASSTAWTKP